MELKIEDISRLKNVPKRRPLGSEEIPVIYRKDRRKKKQDRRKNVRDGVYVSFSFKNDRRNGADRRKRSR